MAGKAHKTGTSEGYRVQFVVRVGVLCEHGDKPLRFMKCEPLCSLRNRQLLKDTAIFNNNNNNTKRFFLFFLRYFILFSFISSSLYTNVFCFSFFYLHFRSSTPFAPLYSFPIYLFALYVYTSFLPRTANPWSYRHECSHCDSLTLSTDLCYTRWYRLALHPVVPTCATPGGSDLCYTRWYRLPLHPVTDMKTLQQSLNRAQLHNSTRSSNGSPNSAGYW